MADKRGNRRSSSAQSRHGNSEEQQNEAVSKLHASMAGKALDPDHAVAGGPPLRPPDRKEMGMTAEALVELKKMILLATFFRSRISFL